MNIYPSSKIKLLKIANLSFVCTIFRSIAEVMAERESLIEALHSELESARADVQRVRSESEHMEQQLRLKINDLESTIGELVSNDLDHSKYLKFLLYEF